MIELLIAYAVGVSLLAWYQWQVRRFLERDAERFRQAAHNARNHAAELALRNAQLERAQCEVWPDEIEVQL
jgi:Tfp pilus assembly protein PilV